MASTSAPQGDSDGCWVSQGVSCSSGPERGTGCYPPKAPEKQQNARSPPIVKRALGDSQPDLSGREAGIVVVPAEQIGPGTDSREEAGQGQGGRHRAHRGVDGRALGVLPGGARQGGGLHGIMALEAMTATHGLPRELWPSLCSE